MKKADLTIEEVIDSSEIEEFRQQDERARRNCDWLQTHWSELLPQAQGKYLAVANQEAFLADTPEEAWRLAKTAHPGDVGAFCQYVFPAGGPRIYANCGRVVFM